MPDLLLELRSEEIPARMQGDGAEALKGAVLAALDARALAYQPKPETFATPRRLALIVRGLPAVSVARTEERRGPRVSAPEAALAGFLRATGLERNALAVQGEGQAAAYVARLEHPGRPLVEHLTKLLPEAIRAVRWPKSMRWSDSRFRWVRPLRGILALVADADTCQQLVPLDLAGIPCSAETRGHPFLAPGPIRIESVGRYEAQLEAARVILRPKTRRERIVEGANAAAQELGLEMVPDPGLVAEIAGLTEWPVVLAGPIDGKFSELPDEILRASMRTHQKFLALRDGRGRVRGFAGCADTEAADGGTLIRAGYARVLRARLEDARFFWENDRRTGLEAMAAGLERRVFHAVLGTMADRMKRVMRLVQQLAENAGADPAMAMRAAALAKNDLNAETVGEFPELQGLIGARLAQQAGEPDAVADAIAGQYRPAGPADQPVREPVAAVLVLADRADTLWGFFAAGERPTASRDPFALRRAALALLRTLLENDLRITLDDLFAQAEHEFAGIELPMRADARRAVTAFTRERLRVHLRNTGLAAGVLAAAERGFEGVDPVRLRDRAKALAEFVAMDSGKDLLAAHRRTTGILEAEKQAEGDTEVDPARLREPAEVQLAAALEQADRKIRAALGVHDDDSGALEALAKLREPVDAFFEQVLVNAIEEDLRRNRLRLLARIRTVMDSVAAFGEVGLEFRRDLADPMVGTDHLAAPEQTEG